MARCKTCGIRTDGDGLCQCPEVLLAEIARLDIVVNAAGAFADQDVAGLSIGPAGTELLNRVRAYRKGQLHHGGKQHCEFDPVGPPHDLEYEDAIHPVSVMFRNAPKESGMDVDEVMTGNAAWSKSGKMCYVFWDDTSMDTFRLNDDGTWKCLGTELKKCEITAQTDEEQEK